MALRFANTVLFKTSRAGIGSLLHVRPRLRNWGAPLASILHVEKSELLSERATRSIVPAAEIVDPASFGSSLLLIDECLKELSAAIF